MNISKKNTKTVINLEEDMYHMIELLQFLTPYAFALLVILIFRKPIVRIIEKSTNLKIKVGGQEINIEDANKQERKLLGEILDKQILLEEKINRTPKRDRSEKKRAKKILWVDDRPQNNALMIEKFSGINIQTEISLSTKDALSKLKDNKYDIIISDMGRVESSKYLKNAGIYLYEELAKERNETPFLIYTSKFGVDEIENFDLEIEGISNSTELYIKVLEKLKK